MTACCSVSKCDDAKSLHMVIEKKKSYIMSLSSKCFRRHLVFTTLWGPPPSFKSGKKCLVCVNAKVCTPLVRIGSRKDSGFIYTETISELGFNVVFPLSQGQIVHFSINTGKKRQNLSEYFWFGDQPTHKQNTHPPTFSNLPSVLLFYLFTYILCRTHSRFIWKIFFFLFVAGLQNKAFAFSHSKKHVGAQTFALYCLYRTLTKLACRLMSGSTY